MSKREYSESSGNVFADLGTPRAEEALAKAELAQKIINSPEVFSNCARGSLLIGGSQNV